MLPGSFTLLSDVLSTVASAVPMSPEDRNHISRPFSPTRPLKQTCQAVDRSLSVDGELSSVLSD